MMNKTLSVILVCALALVQGACAVKEQHRSVEPPTVESYGSRYEGKKHNIIVGKFTNRSTYLRGLFSDGRDPLGDQAKTVLSTHLQQTNRFYLLERDNLDALAGEANFSGEAQAIEGAKYAIVGGVTEFGRRNTGDTQFFGIVGSGKTQLAYTKVMLQVVDVTTTKVVYSTIGAGEYQLTSRQVAGFGTSAGYDATLNGKVLDLAVREAVNKLVTGLENNEWSLESNSQ